MTQTTSIVGLRACTAILLGHAAEIVGRGWCRHADALDGQGRAVDANDDDAVQFSIAGSIRRAAADAIWGRLPALDTTSARRISTAYGMEMDAVGQVVAPERIDTSRQSIGRWNDQQREVSRVQGALLAAAALMDQGEERKVA